MMADVQPRLLRAIVLSDDAETRAGLMRALVLHGFHSLPVSSPTELYRLAGQVSQSICVLDASRHPGQMLALIAQLRRICNIGIVVIVDPEHFEVRVNALLIGADACVVTPVEPRELAALMLGVSRRLSSSLPAELVTDGWGQSDTLPETLSGAGLEPEPKVAEPRAAGWALTEGGWVLLSPEGLCIELSRSERALMQAMAERPDTVLSRELLLEMVDGRCVAGEDGETYNSHRISMLLSRMRKKARRAGMRLPIRVVRGMGYELVEVVALP